MIKETILVYLLLILFAVVTVGSCAAAMKLGSVPVGHSKVSVPR